MKSTSTNRSKVKRKVFKRKLLAIAVANAILTMGTPVLAETIVVGDFGDVSGSNCTLRDAVTSANTDTSVGGCDMGNGTDLIIFDTTQLPNTITLNGTQIGIASEVTIEGPGANQLTISANNQSRVFEVNDQTSNDIPVTLTGLTLSNGSINSTGGALVNFEDLTINTSTISGNIAANGGAFDNRGTLTLTNSTLSGNSATSKGGAISSYGDQLTITNSTISGNTAYNRFGGIASGSSSGLSITNSTITNNSAQIAGGLVFFSNNTVSISNSIFSNNSNGDCNGVLAVNKNNIIADGSCSANAVDFITGDPMLKPLQFNGGPTQTHSLVLGTSPAINSANANDCPQSDQRGFSRPDACDRGSFEAGGISPTIIVNTLSDVVADEGLCTIREAVSSANTDSSSGNADGDCIAGFGADTIRFNPSILPGTITLGGSEITIASNVTIEGPGADILTISANNLSRVFRVTDGSPSLSRIKLNHLTISDGSSNGIGGGLVNYEELTISDSVLSNNTTTDVGGAIDNRGSLYLENSSVVNNLATTGGGISNYGSFFVLSKSTISGNTATQLAGGIISGGATIGLRHTTIVNNSAPNIGGVQLNTSTLSSLGFVIIGDNTNGDCDGAFGHNIFNLIEDGGCPANANSMIVADPMVGPLQNNGGTTPTHDLLPGSPAIDGTTTAFCESEFDQRGAPWPFNGDFQGNAFCDIGSVEFFIDPIFSNGFE